MKLSLPAVVLIIFYVALVVFWLFINFLGLKDSPINKFYAFIYGLIPLLWGLLALVNSKKWGGSSSALGKTLLFIGAGLFTWGVGEMIWSYYNFFLNIEMPYPSWADASFILSWPLWAVGIINMSKVTGARFSLRSLKSRIFLLAVPLLITAASYYLLFYVARGGVLETDGGWLKLFFDLAYPTGDVMILSLAVIIYGLSIGYLGGKFKFPVILLILGLIFNYFADFTFSYKTTIGTFYNGGLADFLFTTAMFLLSLGVTSLDPKILES